MADLASDFDVRVHLAGVVQGDLRGRIFDLLGVLNYSLVAISLQRAGLFVEFAAHVLLDLVMLARSDSNCVFHRVNYNLRIDSLFPTQRFDVFVQRTCHVLR